MVDTVIGRSVRFDPPSWKTFCTPTGDVLLGGICKQPTGGFGQVPRSLDRRSDLCRQVSTRQGLLNARPSNCEISTHPQAASMRTFVCMLMYASCCSPAHTCTHRQSTYSLAAGASATSSHCGLASCFTDSCELPHMHLHANISRQAVLARHHSYHCLHPARHRNSHATSAAAHACPTTCSIRARWCIDIK